MIPRLDLTKSPAHNSTRALKLIPRKTGVADPYAVKKRESNKLALALLPELERRVREASDRLRAAALVAASGNVIDLAIQDNKQANLPAVLDQVFNEGFASPLPPSPHANVLGKVDRKAWGEEGVRGPNPRAISPDDFELFRSALQKAKTIVYLCDNAGEIVFDGVFARALAEGGRRVIMAVHGGPILNDATVADAEEAGLEGEFEVVSTGSDWIGLEPDTCDPLFMARLRSADLVVAKGHGNFETLEDSMAAPLETYFILRAKCAVVAAMLGVREGQVVFRRK